MKKIINLVCASAIALSLSACGGTASSDNTGNSASTEKEYLADDEISNAISNGNDYKGKYIKITGKVFNNIGEDSDGNTQYQAYYDIANYDEDFVFVVASGSEKLNNDEYVSVDGQITGAEKYENYFGQEMETLVINADTVTKISYMDAVVPTLISIEPALSQEQNGITISVDKVEFAETETRVYLTETNNSSDVFDLWTYEATIVQNGMQIDLSDGISQYEGDYPTLSTSLTTGASSSGIIVFKPVDSTQGFQLNLPCSSENYEIKMSDFTFDVPAAQ
jgi:hypothetical protein